ncbi:protein SHORTAGE IN CHIASMATA 1 isoform X3 [Tripterygium wilfordii]|uniref:protein SHORTAGE IN CHIASMATA 1 isoform X3 n=1 Tax=Tripterygium wilfordii TaxID=458696 RepID=UPI0018F838F3|nr:protein SHORTAGE IN CHIASMATA 1 isoform X3 [Tripterygium wilfordii]XP_038709586.1 protein SHORTAGE IN CHIASMATA 1 isoform X3 [Tripterygium wilfordii]
MRTRFLNTDYFASSSSPIEIPRFLNLPIPHLPPSRLFNYYEDNLPIDSPLDVSLVIERLPIDLALSKFLAEVIPQPVDVRYEDFEADRFRDNEGSADNEGRKDAETFYEEGEVENHGCFGSQTLDVELSRENNGTSRDTNNFEIVQFETQVLDVFSESACFFEKEEMQIFFKVLEIEHNVDMLKPGLTIQYSDEVQESVYSVEDVPVECPMEKTAHVSEDAGSVLDKTKYHLSTFPLLEVEETNLGFLSNVNVADELISLLENIESHEWTKTDELPISGKGLLGYMGYDIVELHLDHYLSKQYLESELASLDVFERVDIISTVDSLEMNEDSAFHQWASDSDSSLLASPVIFQEFEVIDVNSSHLFEIFFDTERIYGLETCDSPFRKDMNFKIFDELIVSNELTLLDDAFKSLPIPIVSDHARIRSLDIVIEEVLAEVKQEPFSTAHEIYLDWHLLDGDKCNCQTYSPYQNMLAEKDMIITKFDWKSDNDENLEFNFILSDDALTGPNAEEHRESLNMVSDGIMLDVNINLMGVASSKSSEEKSPKLENGDQLAGKSSVRASLLFKSMSHFNDFDIFLNPQKANVGANVESSVKALDYNSTICKASSGYSSAAHTSTGIQFQQWVITLYKVKLSDDILALIDNFEKRYLAILQNETDMINAPHLYSAANDLKLLSLSKETLMDYIKKRSLHRTTISEDETIMDFFSLCVIKQTAWYLSFFGIHAAHLYINKISQALECLKSRLGVLQSLIEDSHEKAEREITRSHPLLSVIYEILQPNNAKNSLKVLIVTDRVFWRPLKHLLMSMEISSSELQESYSDTNQPDGYYSGDVAKDKTDFLLVSECVLVPHDHVSASFPFNKFSMILEYGGSYGMSRISSLSPQSAVLPRLHFLKVDLDNFGACKALCEGFGMTKYFDSSTVEESHSSLRPGEIINLQKLEELLNFVPIRDIRSSETADKVKDCCMPLPVPCTSHVRESEQIQQGILPFVDRVIIVNTQNIDKDMIVSRRSMYQKILALEKGGTQVVERDLDLPVDIIISSAICLVWYDCRNIGKKATSLDEASSCLPLCIENIATDILTSLSFKFGCCILLFEGEINFLSTVMESSDGLYAAAASLGIDLQLFYSYSFESTNEIILGCIRCASKLSNCLYPKMPESETLAESFLTKFPSINPLTAHAILSEEMLIEFLECSHDSRIRAIQKYHVSEEIVALFSALSIYGEREDSKSIMTDCSSSVSSGPDSDKCHMKVGSDIKRQKCIASPPKVDLRMDKLLHSGIPNELPNGIMLQFSEPCNHWMSKHLDEFDELDMPDSSFYDLFSDKQKLNSSRVLKTYGDENSKDALILDEFKSSRSSLSEKLFGQNLGLATLSNVDLYPTNKSENHRDGFIGEVIDLTRSPLVYDKFSIDNVTYSYFAPELEKDSTRKPKIVRRLSFDKSDNPAFQVDAKVNSGSDVQTFVKDRRQRLQEKGDERNDLEEESMQRSAGVSKQLAFKEGLSHYGATPLSKAIGSVHPQPGSPWTMEFLNRIREKSRLRQQSLPYEAPSPGTREAAHMVKYLEERGRNNLYDHQAHPRMRVLRLLFSQRGHQLTRELDSENQAKLVWSDGNTHCPSKKFQNHF